MNNKVKKEISESAIKLAEYVHNQKFEGVLISGGSNQLSRSLLTLAWQSMYKDEEMPHLYIFNQKANTMLYKSEVQTSEIEPQIMGWISVNLPNLERIRDKKLCYVDDFAITGGKYVLLKTRFEHLEFSNLKFAFFGGTTFSELGEDVFVGTLDAETVRELQILSQQIQGNPSYAEILQQVELTAQTRRQQALNSLKDLGQSIRMK